MKNIVIYIFLIIIAGAGILNGCRKDPNSFDQNAQLSFSSDTILFDTIFTTIGSTTKLFKIYNTSNQSLLVSNIYLEDGTNSMFRINVDGIAGTQFENIEVLPNDSLFLFTEVTIDPTNSNNPEIVSDRVKFVTNGIEQQVILNAFGQDAYFHVNEIITTDETWPTDKPHVIYNYCAVDSAVTLTIPAGAKVHAYNNSFIYVYKSSLQVQGTLGNEVEFLQSRSEDFILASADSVAGQWRGLYFFAPENSKIEYASITNAEIGIQIDTLQGNDSLTLENIRIDNSAFAGIVTQGGNVYANSCLFGNSGSYSAFFSIGGNVFCDHCTFGNYWNGQRNSVLFAFKDYYIPSIGLTQYRPFNKVIIKNSIIYGNNENEVGLDTIGRSSTGEIPNLSFINTLLKSEEPVINPEFYFNCWRNIDPEFTDTFFWDFHVENQTAVDQKGTTTNPISDLDGNWRNSTGNDLGCYNQP